MTPTAVPPDAVVRTTATNIGDDDVKSFSEERKTGLRQRQFCG
jgi:hypothetical protein